jgi:predicted MPP superfamily phosphohydrolase
MYVSDIHLRRKRSETLCRQVIEAVRNSETASVLLGGDLVDDSSQLDTLRNLVGALRTFARVLAIGGNHDRRVGMDRVRDAVVSGGGEWIHETAVRLTHGSRVIAIAGPNEVSAPEGDYRILCAHNPRVWTTARTRGYDLVLAGHLHGCQVVAFEYRDRLFPGAMFYPHCFIRHRWRRARLVVSRGVSDRFPVRWRCPREVVLCHV